MPPRPAYTFGIEEEFFLVSPRTRQAVSRGSGALIEACRARLGDCIEAEMLGPQLEIASPVFEDADTALATLRRLRRDIAALAQPHGIAIVAAGTHPLSAWQRQRTTRKPRYQQLVRDFRLIGRRNLVCGMHVHVEVPARHDRVVLMNRLLPWLPLFLALSTSSPFWARRNTGLMSYRQAAYDEFPRTGIPDFFADQADYDAFVATLVRAGAMEDASHVWWAIRPALRYPTLELRIADCCTAVEDGVALATLYRCLVHCLVRRPSLGKARGTATRRIVDENRWRAKRDGIEAEFIVEGERDPVSLRTVLARLRETIAPDAAALGCDAALRQLDVILTRGTSAQRQLAVYRAARDAGAGQLDAVRGVVDWLIEATVPPPAHA
ncbi:carboxylate-amine ligase [Chiayiivirga flava]|uniref:Putative glutamate--cysteine ligase 2 n=1 Tax=Chiayiivirga flava TaxID=659595 RepID=A0A7W8D8V8_9GAMM|nr:carboxylate-amine ligase [Chiayiivirga flava]MBB5209757.1 carboxylate-amine ligase [Chiayiivirga flava]